MFKPLTFGLGGSASLLALGQLGGRHAQLGLLFCDQAFGLQQPLSLFVLVLGLCFESGGSHLDLASGLLQRPIAFRFPLLGRERLPLGQLGAPDGLVGFAFGRPGVFVCASHGRLLPLSLGAGGAGHRLRILGVAPGLLQLQLQLGVLSVGLRGRLRLSFSLELCLGLGLRLGLSSCLSLVGLGLCLGLVGFGLCLGLVGFGLCLGLVGFGLRLGLVGFGLCLGLVGFGLRLGLVGLGLRLGLVGFGLCLGLVGFGLCLGLVGFGSCLSLVGFGLCLGLVGFGSCLGPVGLGLCLGLVGFGLRLGTFGLGTFGLGLCLGLFGFGLRLGLFGLGLCLGMFGLGFSARKALSRRRRDPLGDGRLFQAAPSPRGGGRGQHRLRAQRQGRWTRHPRHGYLWLAARGTRRPRARRGD